jgi:phage repressor protein C with HTH and peptisase S24 domain
MVPAYRHGDRLLVRWGGAVRAGDVVIARLPDRPLSVKRAVRRVGGGWWLEGDNQFASTDSRTFGAVADADVLGRVVLRYWPPRSA